MRKRQSKKPDFEWKQEGKKEQREFGDVFQELVFNKGYSEEKLSTFSPLDSLDAVTKSSTARSGEVGREDMMANEAGMRKLLANMLQQCKPGLLSESDMEQLSGINGREVNLDR